jgi:hypothetical protein
MPKFITVVLRSILAFLTLLLPEVIYAETPEQTVGARDLQKLSSDDVVAFVRASFEQRIETLKNIDVTS